MTHLSEWIVENLGFGCHLEGSKKGVRMMNICLTPMLLLMMLGTSEVLTERFTCK